MRLALIWLLASLCLGSTLTQRHALAADVTVTSENFPAVYEDLLSKAVSYCQSKAQSPDGSYGADASPAVTAIVTAGILKAGRSPDDPQVARGLKYVQGFVRPDGGIYAEGSAYQNYETSLAIQCFAAANRDKRFDALLANAERFVKNLQWDDTEGKDRSNPAYGGAGYGNNKRADLSNTSFLIDSLKSLGRGSDDEAMQKALVFVSRCQNLETQYNLTPFAAKNPDGGFYYTPDAGGFSQAGNTPQGALRSYGSMTYAGLKSMIFAGLNKDDPRVKAAVEWLRANYRLDENPGMGSSGLYYYYHTMSKALDVLGSDEFIDSKGTKHVWRNELLAALASRQKPDGSWVNEDGRWQESNPNLVTGYVLMTLSNLRPGGDAK